MNFGVTDGTVVFLGDAAHATSPQLGAYCMTVSGTSCAVDRSCFFLRFRRKCHESVFFGFFLLVPTNWCAHVVGQGANLALVDAWTLSNSVAQFAVCCEANVQIVTYCWLCCPCQRTDIVDSIQDGSDSGIASALAHYDASRRWRLRFYQLNSHLLTPVFQSNSRVIGHLRDAFMGYMCYIWLTRMQMLTVMCGAQNNGIPWTTIPEDEFLYHVRP